jgi:hypothetical protein
MEECANMAGKRNTSGKRAGRDIVEIKVDGNHNAVATHGGRATVSHTQVVSDDWKAWRDQMECAIKALKGLPAEDKSMLVQNVEQVAIEAKKGEEADPSRMERLLNTISAMAPDILDVAITTLGNPLAGLGLVVKKVGEKAKVTREG